MLYIMGAPSDSLCWQTSIPQLHEYPYELLTGVVFNGEFSPVGSNCSDQEVMSSNLPPCLGKAFD